MNSQEKLNSEQKVFTRVPCCNPERNTTKISITLLIVIKKRDSVFLLMNIFSNEPSKMW